MRRAALAAAHGEEGLEELAVSVWVRLLRCEGVLLRELRGRTGRDLTLPQFDVVAQLDRHEEGMTLSELTRELLVTAGNVTGLVNRLEARGLVERRSVPGDRRARRVLLTSSGRGLAARTIPRHRRQVRTLLGCMGRANLERLRDLLGLLAREVAR